jgi:Family of unknown function (DUF6328)
MTTRPTEEPAATPLDIKIEQMLTGARVILPGAQALFGFQLAIVFTRSLADLPVVSMIMHATSLVLVTLTVILLMAPAAYHRIVYAGEASADMYRVGSALATSGASDLGDHSISAWTCGGHVCRDDKNHRLGGRRHCGRRRGLYLVDRALARLPIGSSW